MSGFVAYGDVLFMLCFGNLIFNLDDSSALLFMNLIIDKVKLEDTFKYFSFYLTK